MYHYYLNTLFIFKIFIDYGENWENAWNAHVEKWNMQKWNNDESIYTPVQILVENNDYRTLDELKANPYPENIQLLCYGGKLIDTEGNLVDRYGVSNEGKIVTLIGPNGFENNIDEISEPNFLFPCDIHKKNIGTSQYEVQINFEQRSVKVKNYPEESIQIMPTGYSSDQHLEGAFRHFMEIDDDIFPNHWKEN